MKKLAVKFLISLIALASLLSVSIYSALAYSENDYSAQKVQQNYENITIAPSKAITIEVKYKNTGTAPWYNYGPNLVAINPIAPVGRQSPFQHKFWSSPKRPAILLNKEVKPGETGTFKFALQSPAKEGSYIENYQIAARGITWIKGGELRINIVVGVKTQERKNEETKERNTNTQEQQNITTNEPKIRIGLFDTTDLIKIKADKNYKIKGGDKTLVEISANTETNVTYNAGTAIYTLTSGNKTITTTSYLKFISDDPNVIFEIPSYSHPVGWKTSLNDNLFRNALEIHFATATKKLWVINELPLESYLKGTAEIGLSDHFEYQKTMSVAMRTYAYYRMLNPKHQAENFDLDALHDQVYRGYGMEKRSPTLVNIMNATSGEMVYYNNQLTITPYFTQSNGKIKNWSEVFGGAGYPWLTAKDDPQCAGMTQLGHGVGMSGCGARGFAKEGKTYDWILKYYYTGTEIKKTY